MPGLKNVCSVPVTDREKSTLAFQKVDDPTPGKNKVHLDIHTDDDLDAEVARWTAAGATDLGTRNAGDFSWVTLADPDGNRMEFQVDACSVEAANAYMRSAAFAANPIGVVYDPEDLLSRWKAGASENELLAMPPGPPSAIPAAHGF